MIFEIDYPVFVFVFVLLDAGVHGAVGLGRRLRWSHCARAGDAYHKSLGPQISSLEQQRIWNLISFKIAMVIPVAHMPKGL